MGGGQFAGRMPQNFPLILGVDVAGRVEALGEGAGRFAVGDTVYGQFFRAPLGAGTFAEFAVAPERMPTGAVRAAPTGLDTGLAGAFPTAGMTALGVLDAIGLRGGQTVLIVGATGGVGSFATQLAAARGAHVIATARPGAEAWVRGLGAAETVGYSPGGMGEAVRAAHPDGVDALVDLVGDQDSFAAGAALVRDGGAAVSVAFGAPAELLSNERIKVANYMMDNKHELLGRLTREIEEGRLRAAIQDEVELPDVPAALARNRAGGARGKVLVRI